MTKTNSIKSVDVAALELLCDKLECGDANHRATAAQIRKAMSGAERLHEVNREVDVDALLKVADEMSELVDVPPYKAHPIHASTIRNWRGAIRNALKRPEPEVLDADGVPIKVGDTVWVLLYEPTSSPFKVAGFNHDSAGNPRVLMTFHSETSMGYAPDVLTHRKPDTQEAINADVAKTPCLYFNPVVPYRCAECPAGNGENDVEYPECCAAQVRDLLKRQRKLMGGE